MPTARDGRYLEMPMNTRSWLYRIARWMGDYQAVRKGRVGRRVGRRVAGKATGRMLRKLFR